jgi:H+/Cl- antiporter ClcA
MISIHYHYCCRYALLGAASFLGGSMRMTVSLCVIMVEITNNLKLLPLIMLVLLVSKVLTLQPMTLIFIGMGRGF